MKVLVTGGNGFIGAQITKELVSRGIDVVSFDIVPPRNPMKGVQYVQGTILDTFALSRLLKGCDAVFHLAAILGVKRADLELLKCLSVNIQGTVAVLEAAVMSGVKHFFVSSSSEVFGDVNTGSLTETSPLNPKSGYAISKLAAEQYILGFHKEYGINYNVVRFFNVYGPGQVAEFVVPRFIKMVQNGQAPTIYGDGAQVRSFCHTADACRAVVDIFMKKEAHNQTFNVGNDLEPVNMKTLAEKTIKVMGLNLKPVYVPFNESDRNVSREIFYRVPDITKIRQMIRYEPRINLEDGIRSVIESGDIPASWVETAETAS